MASPSDIAAQLQEALALHGRGQLAGAEQRYRAIFAEAPDHALALHMLGVIHLQRGENAEAADLIGEALKFTPNDSMALSNRGLALRALGRFIDAVMCFEKAAMLQPANAAAHYNRALTLNDLGRRTEALAGFERAIALDPNYADAHGERARTLTALDRYDEALRVYDTALALKPNDAGIHHNRGQALMGLNRYDHARAAFSQAIDLQPDFAEAHTALGECLLVQGDSTAGWCEYEWRWATKGLGATARDFPQPRWRGDTSTAGKTLLLHAEQGFGDTIQFCRYAPLAAARGARVLLEVPGELTRLLEGLDGCDVIARGTPLPHFDAHAPLMSLPLAFGGDGIPPPPHLTVDPVRVDTWKARFNKDATLHVGVVWAGRATHLNDRKRTVPLEIFAPLLAVPNVEFVTLQKEVRPADEKHLAALKLTSFNDELQDFADTASLISVLDLVITVDTAVAHLAGTLGKPVWTLLSASPDWRWMLERDDTPWYPSMRLFRQFTPGAWPDVMARVTAELRKLTVQAR